MEAERATQGSGSGKYRVILKLVLPSTPNLPQLDSGMMVGFELVQEIQRGKGGKNCDDSE